MNDYHTIFPALDPSSKLWIYVANQKLTLNIVQDLEANLQSFIGAWSSHGRTVLADFQIVDQQIVILSAFVEQGEISGCGIDKSLHVLEQFAEKNGFEWLGHLSIMYRDESGHLHIVSRAQFRALAKEGVVTEATVVLDSSISSLSELRNGGFERSAGTSWHGRVFQLPTSLTI